MLQVVSPSPVYVLCHLCFDTHIHMCTHHFVSLLASVLFTILPMCDTTISLSPGAPEASFLYV